MASGINKSPFLPLRTSRVKCNNYHIIVVAQLHVNSIWGFSVMVCCHNANGEVRNEHGNTIGTGD